MKYIMNKNCGIYKITSPTGKIYIGQSTNIKKRFTRYYNINSTKKQPIIHRSFLKYGVENHQFDIIEYCSEDELNCSERFWQDEFNVIGKNGLNCQLVNTELKRRVYSEETKKIWSEQRKGEGNSNFGKNWSQEWKDNHSSFMQGRAEGSKNPCFGLFGSNHPAFGSNKNLGIKRTKEQIDRVKKSGVHARENNGRAKLVLCIETGIFYMCAKDAADAHKIPYYMLTPMLRGENKNTTNLIYC